MFSRLLAARRLGRAPRRYFRPRLETLEDRLAPTADYSLTNLGAIGAPQAINNSGLVGATVGDLLGFSNIQVNLYNINTNQATPLPAIPSNSFGTFNTTSLIGINDSGQIFVDSYSNEYDAHQAFRYNSLYDSNPTQLGPITSLGLPVLGVSPVAVNNSGQVLYNVQASFSNGLYPIVYEPGIGKFQLLYPSGLPTGYSNVEALGLNNSGQILVNATTTAGVSNIVLLDSNGATTTLLPDFLWGFNKDFANAVLNNSGQAAINPVDGNGVYHVDLYNGKWTDLNGSLPPGYSDPMLVGMNDAGQILANATMESGTSAVSRPLLYSNGQWNDLNNLLASAGSVTLIGAGGINNNDQIVAEGADSNVYLLTPQQGLTQQQTTTSLLAEPDNVPAGQSVTLTATVANVAPGSGAPPGGSVTFVNGSTTLGTVTLANGTAILPATLPAGSNSITATYNGVTQGNTVYNSSTSSPVTVTVTVQTPPAITSGSSAVFTIGQGGIFIVTATGSPTPTLKESETLPTGIAFSDNGNGTAALAGAPAAGTQGTYYFTIKADNGVGNDAIQNFALTVNPAPMSPSPPSSPSTPPSPPPPPTLNVPPLLALFDSWLGGTETVNPNGTETIRDFLFGIPLMVSTFDQSGNLVSVTLFGINVTFLFA